MEKRIQDAGIEAADNLAHLHMLQRFFEPLYRKEPLGIGESLPSLMHAIRMVNSMSRYYNTSERITALLIKVTNQMVNACKNYLTENGSTRLWAQEPQSECVPTIASRHFVSICHVFDAKTPFSDRFRRRFRIRK